jgi:Concanavalin A-like lectin/glucanases superfamily
MAISYPIDLLPGFPGWTTGFSLRWRQEQSTQASGRVLVKDLGAPLWTLRAASKVLSPNNLDAWRARLEALENGLQTFWGYPMTRCYPIAYPNGSWPTGTAFVGNGTVGSINANRKAITLAGLPPGFVLSVGDYLSIAGDLHQVMEAAIAPAGATDPYLSNVKLLLGFEGVDAAVSGPGMTDESSAAHGTATVAGTAQIDTAQSKFNTASLLLNGSTDKISFPDSADWELTGQFTIEMFLRINSFPSSTNVILSHGASSINYGWFLSVSNVGLLRFRFDDNADGVALHDIAQTIAQMTTGVWYHIAVDRDAANTLRLYVDGVMRATKVSATGSSFNAAAPLIAGRFDIFPFNGWIDELRITQGAARYASDAGFAVPTAAFPRPGATATTPQFEIRPHLWPGVAAGAAVSLVRPACLMAVVPGSISSDAQLNGWGSISFSAIEARL